MVRKGVVVLTVKPNGPNSGPKTRSGGIVTWRLRHGGGWIRGGRGGVLREIKLGGVGVFRTVSYRTVPLPVSGRGLRWQWGRPRDPKAEGWYGHCYVEANRRYLPRRSGGVQRLAAGQSRIFPAVSEIDGCTVLSFEIGSFKVVIGSRAFRRGRSAAGPSGHGVRAVSQVPQSRSSDLLTVRAGGPSIAVWAPTSGCQPTV
eukprot:751546-Hanusia_phi.AAC.5